MPGLSTATVDVLERPDDEFEQFMSQVIVRRFDGVPEKRAIKMSTEGDWVAVA